MNAYLIGHVSKTILAELAEVEAQNLCQVTEYLALTKLKVPFGKEQEVRDQVDTILTEVERLKPGEAAIYEINSDGLSTEIRFIRRYEN